MLACQLAIAHLKLVRTKTYDVLMTSLFLEYK